MALKFDYAKAIEALKTKPEVAKFLNMNKDQFVALAEPQIYAIVLAYIGGDDAGTVNNFYPNLDDAMAGMVTDTASIAYAQYAVKQRALTLGIAAAKLIAEALAAGVIL